MNDGRRGDMLYKKIILTLLLLPMPCMAVEKITVIGLFKDKAVVNIDGKQHVLTAGKNGPEGVKLISSNSTEAIIEINGRQDTYTMGTHISSEFAPPLPGTTVTIAPDSAGMYEVNGSINGFQVRFVVDTGATLISMNKHEAKRIGLNYKLEGTESLSETASGYSKTYLVTLKEVRVGDIVLHNVQGAVHDSDFPKVILLGNSFLGRVNLNREGALLQLEHE
jgi:aspartyl protease family protein